MKHARDLEHERELIRMAREEGLIVKLVKWINGTQRKQQLEAQIRMYQGYYQGCVKLMDSTGQQKYLAKYHELRATYLTRYGHYPKNDVPVKSQKQIRQINDGGVI